MKRSLAWIPILAVMTGAALGASSGLYIKRLAFSSLALTGFRMGIPVLLMLPAMIRNGRVFGLPGRSKGLWMASTVNAVRMLLYVMAFKLTSVGNAVVLLYLWPIFALVFDAAMTKRAPGVSRIALVALSFAGVIVMNLHRGFGLSNGDLYGSLLMIASAAGFAFTVILFKKALESVGEADAVYFQNAVGAIVYLPFLVSEIGLAPARDIALAAVYGGTVGMVGFFCFFFAMKRLPIFQYGTLAYIEVLLGVILGVIVLGESFVPNQLVGAIMVVSASYLAQRLRSAKPAVPVPASGTAGG
jgi:drug/metabolite transporter (DMT)-like permease